jgi:hypothetical protein
MKTMNAKLKSGSQIVLLLALSSAVPIWAWGQAPSPHGAKQNATATAPKKIQEDTRENPKSKPPVIEVREASSVDSEADAESEGNQRSVDRELVRLRQQFEREALNRMRFGPGESSFDRIRRDVVPFSVFLVITLLLAWILRLVLDNRRWYRMVKVQTDIHMKLLDRFSSSQDMIAYMDSEAGRRFLESPRFDIQPKQAAMFPYGRILWSAQVALIMATLGAGMLFLRGRVPADGDAPLLVLGTLALMLGLGFLLSAAASYLLSKHFGLLEQSASASETNVRQG